MNIKQSLLSLMVIFTIISLSTFSISIMPSMNPEINPNIQPKPSTPTSSLVQTDFGKLPLYFIANQGQMDSQVAYYVQGSDKTLFFTAGGVAFSLTDLTPQPPSLAGKGKWSGLARSKVEVERSERWNVKLDFIEANQVQPMGIEPTQAIISYFKGSQDEWRTALPTYSKISYPNLWQGIDLTYSGTVDRLKYEFVLQPGANSENIQLAYHGASIKLNDAGQLEVSTPHGGFTDDAPTAYQEMDGRRVPVDVSYLLLGEGNYGFQLGAYNPTLPLVIDPAVLVYCGFIGGDDSERAYSIAVDTSGNTYITGETASTETTFPVTVGPYTSYNGGSLDAFVAKVASDGTGLVYAGYIGGDDADVAHGISVDASSNAYIVGETQSTEATFPVITGPDLDYNGGYKDAFVAKVNAAGTGLIYAGYIGGDGLDDGWSIATDTGGNAYITGYTIGSTEDTFPVASGPDLTYNGMGDAFVAKVKADGTALDYAGYIGGASDEWGYGIAVDTTGCAYVTGETKSTEVTFPILVGPDLSYNLGDNDAFVAKVRSDGTGFVYSGYIGGHGSDIGYSIAIDSTGSAYVTGSTQSTELSFPVLGGPDLTYNGGSRDVFVTKVKPDGSGLLYAGYIGGNDWDFGYGIAVDSAFSAYVTGYTFSTETTFPVIDGPDLTHNGGYWDAFVAKVNPAGARLMYCGYIGGDDTDIGRGIAVDTAGNAYIAGLTDSFETTFPVTIGPDLSSNGAKDAFVAKISAVETVEYYIYLPSIIR